MQVAVFCIIGQFFSFSCFKGLMIGNISFKGTYKINSANNPHEKIMKAIDFFGKLSYEDPEAMDYPEFPEKLGDGTKLTYVISDFLDFDAEKYLKAKGINFRRVDDAELFDKNSIKARVVLPNQCSKDNWQVVEVKTKEFNEFYKNSTSSYIGDRGSIDEPKYNEKFKKYLKSGLEIGASQVYLREVDGVPEVTFNDGRHRYAVMRDDLGFDKMPIALDRESIEVAKKYGLVD